MSTLTIKDFRFIFYCFIIFGILSFYNCENNGLKKINKNGKIQVITDNNANCYYLYKNQPMGLEYELAKGFADFLGVELELITPSWQEMVPMLLKNRADIIAANLTITDNRQSEMDFSIGILPIQQFVITNNRNDSITTEQDLAGETIHVRKNTSYHERLLELKNQGIDLFPKLYDDLPSEEFIRRVSIDDIPLTISDSHIARLNRRYYPNIQLAFPIEEQQEIGWAVKKGNSKLLKKINQYFTQIKKNGTFDKLYNKYYGTAEIFDYVDLLKFHERIDKRLPKYESKIKTEAAKYSFDWRLIAAMIYQESHFNPHARSYTGVRGLMQLTLVTAREMGIKSRLNPEQSIQGGVKYLNKIYQRFDDVNTVDRMKFTMASYNIGYGHIRDAQMLAEQQKMDKNTWNTMIKVLPLLRYRKYYKQTRYGYARGTEPVRYVERIMSYYEILRRQGIN
ncbi:MAG: membrane-bound lytic murein transglycosylase MltF [Fidelibacterota bacterium]